jgi:hypothetical protein
VSIPKVKDVCYELIKIKNVKITEIIDKSHFYVQDVNNNKLQIYTGDQNPVFDCTASLQVGDTLDISGIAWNYNGEAEIHTRFDSDYSMGKTKSKNDKDLQDGNAGATEECETAA